MISAILEVRGGAAQASCSGRPRPLAQTSAADVLGRPSSASVRPSDCRITLAFRMPQLGWPGGRIAHPRH